ncbi:MAG: cobalamin biosynthesis protein, partial [Chloroflexi bacterium]|nr:cobalamin biosynthesis protein [Chloroflexota bacterium]
MEILLILVLAVALDLTIGEPPRAIHPVVWMGKVVSFLVRGGNGQAHLP